MAKKRKSMDGRMQRAKDKVRKCQKRLESKALPDESQTDSSEPHGRENSTALADLEQGFIGLPPLEGKPLARVQASPCERMYSTATRLPSPRGRRLIVPKDKVASPDSRARVCTPARVPEFDMWSMSNSAGQTHVASSWGEDVGEFQSKKIGDHQEGNIEENLRTKKEKNDIEETNKKETLRKNDIEKESTEMNIMKENLREMANEKKLGYENENSIHSLEHCMDITGIYEKKTVTPPTRNVQGSFHQGDALFGENAGTQCVAMSLAALAFHQKKNTENWETSDMNTILLMGNELYSYLQSSSTMNERYLLASELPECFECFNSLFEFKPNESLPSLINLANVEVNHDDFNAYSLLEALQLALGNTDGCFVCFGGSTFLVGKTGNKFFTFDSHSRSTEGHLSANGKSTRLLHESVLHIYNHVLSLALSMGYSTAVQCEITGVHCSMKQDLSNKDENPAQNLQHIGRENRIAEFQKNESCDINQKSSYQSVEDEDVEYICTENESIRFAPLCSKMKKQLCEKLLLPYSAHDEKDLGQEEDIGAPLNCIEIFSDGNCFFRAISFCLTGKQDHHQKVRSAVCNHLLQNELIFRPFLRRVEESVENYLLERKMFSEGTWATEMEILALSHLLNINIHTYSDAHWKTFSGQMVNSSAVSQGAVYLNHKNLNHYEVVTKVGQETQYSETIKVTGNKAYVKRQQHKNYMGKVRDLLKTSKAERRSKRDSCKEKKLRIQRIRYQQSEKFRSKAKTKSKEKYKINMKHRENVKRRSTEKYRVNMKHREDVKGRSTEKYRVNMKHREDVKGRSTEKYRVNMKHREDVKGRSTEKYKVNMKHREGVKGRSTKKYRVNMKHREDVKGRSTEKYRLDTFHREDMKLRSRQKYKVDNLHREDVKQRSKDKYKTNELHRENVKFRGVQKYQNDVKHKEKVKAEGKIKYHLCAETKSKKKESVRKKRSAVKMRLENEDEVVRLFLEEAKKGPEFTCCCCHRLLFENQVQRCAHEMYDKNDETRRIASTCIDNKYVHLCTLSCPKPCKKSSLWICYTCHRKILGGNIPAEAAANKMSLEDIPEELCSLNSLEQHLIALHIPFMKVMALPQGRQRNIHGPVVCVPSNLRKTASLPRASDENMLLRVKLKRRLSYKGYFEYQFVNPRHIMAALKYLKENNQWYQDVVIDTTWKDSSEQSEYSLNDSEALESEGQDEEDINEIPEVVTDTCLQPVDIAQDVLDHYFDDVYNIAPSEGKNPIRMLQAEGNEAKTFPHLFPSGKFSWNENRSTRITLSRYFNNRLMNTDNRFAKDTDYIFFSQYMSELNQVIEKTQISIRKSFSKVDGGKNVTSEMLQNPVLLSKLLKNNEALRFMQPIRGTPAYWSNAQKDLFAMLRQLGIPTWFCSFSSAEFRWNDIVATILQHGNDSRNPTDLDWSEKSEILRNNPVTVARMFDHRFHIFQRDVIMSPAKPIGNVIDYFVRVEFQQRGSPHMHCLYWIENAPKLNEDSEETVCDFIDKYVTCALPSEDEDPELQKIVLDVQQHSKSHSKSCRKKKTECRFNFPRPPSEKTFISRPCEQETVDTMDERLKTSQAKEILLNVWNEVLVENSERKTTEEIFESIELCQDLYEMAHKVLSTKLTTILKRNPVEMWTNQYNPCLLRSWNANMDIQYILDPFSCIVYIVSYISKSEREMGMLLKQTQIEAREGNLSAQQTIRHIGTAYLNHREVSAQEAVYRVCNLKMKECSRNTVFIPVGENPTRLSKPLAEIKKKQRVGNEECSGNIDIAEDDDEDIWMTNIVERYENRPVEDAFMETCLAEFCSEFRVLAKSQIPQSAKESVFELRNGKGYIQKRTRSKAAIVRYPRFNRENEPEKYYQAMLQLFLPYWKMDHLKPPGFELYETFFENGYIRTGPHKSLQAVKSIVQRNHATYSKYEGAIENAEEALEMLGEPDDAWARLCPETELSRQECQIEKEKTEEMDKREPEITHEIEDNGSQDLLFHVAEPSHSREEIIPMLQGLNMKQKEIFYAVHEWCLNKISGENIEPLHVFVTGGAGTGKSHLIKTIHYEASRLFQRTLNSPDDLSVILTAFTGTAAFNIGGNTIHHVFSLKKSLPFPYEPLKEQNLCAIRTRLECLQILIIDEVSMVYKRLLYYIHERLVQIKKCKEPFGGVSVIAVGDFYQLPPVKQRKDERLFKENGSYPVDYWLNYFKIVELDEVMRQREDYKFACVLNSLRVRLGTEAISDQAKTMLQECIREGPENVLHVYSTNQEANEYNLKMLRANCRDLTEVQAEDFQKDNTTGKLSLRSKPYVRMTSDGLPTTLLLAVNARVMLTRNVNVEDGLVNGTMGHVSHLEYRKDQKNCVQNIGVVFDSKDTGKLTGMKTSNGNLVLISRAQEDIKEKNTRNVVRHQFPLKLSWACTAHKVQGMTTQSVVVNLDRAFSAGQAYVAISRVTSKNGLFIETNDEDNLFNKIYADPDVKLALSGMEKFIPEETKPYCHLQTKNYLTILLFNVQSLRRHIRDITSDSRFLKADFIALTETWLRDDENIRELQLDAFDFHHVPRKQCYNESDGNFAKLHSAKGGGVGLYRRHAERNVLVKPLSQNNLEGLTVELYSHATLVIIVYRPSILNVHRFLDSLWGVVCRFQEQYSNCVIIGDFNEDIKTHGPIQMFLESKGFKQIVHFYTTEGGTTIDHVYVTEQVDAVVKKMPVYFSYHEAVEIILKTKEKE